MDKKKCFVTGATGCLGRNLIDVLIKDDWDITVLVRKTSNLFILAGTDVTIKKVNLHDLADVEKALTKADALFHLAANVSHHDTTESIAEQHLDNVIATRNLTLASLNKINRFIYCSTGAVAMDGKFDSSYVHTKALAEKVVEEAGTNGLKTIILRPIICVGKYDNRNYSKIAKMIKDGSLNRAIPGRIAFCSASAVAEAHLAAYKYGNLGETYWLGGEYTSWHNFMNLIAKKYGKTIKRPYPFWFFKIIIGLQELVIKKPALTTTLVDLICTDTNDVSEAEYFKAFKHLNYKPKTLTYIVDEMLGTK